MKYRRVPHPLFGFLCAACGRCLEELPAWQLGKERFYCGLFCREADEAREAGKGKAKLKGDARLAAKPVPAR